MSSIAVIAIAVAFLVLLVVAARVRSRVPQAGTQSVPDSESAVRLPPLAVLERCLSAEDIEFTAGLREPGILRLLLAERRRLALQWNRQTRREVSRVFRLHLRAARQSAGLRPGAELSVLCRAISFAFLSQILAAVVHLYGPFRTRAFLRSIRSLANILTHVGGRIVVASPGTFSAASNFSK